MRGHPPTSCLPSPLSYVTSGRVKMAPMSGGRQAVLLALCCLAMSWVSADSPLVSVCPRENALLRCIFTVEDSEGNVLVKPSVNLRHLVVVWKHGNKNVLTFKNTTTVYRLGGAKIDMKQLVIGNASIMLPHVETADCGDYTCEIAYNGEKQKVYRILHIDDTKNCDYQRVRRQMVGGHSSDTALVVVHDEDSGNPLSIRRTSYVPSDAVDEDSRTKVIIGLFIWLFAVAVTSIMLWCKGTLQ